jgi:class 3 adenylate cyclase
MLEYDNPVPSLVVKEGPLNGRELNVESQLVLGRGDADVVIDDPEISRRHALIRADGDFFEIEDLDSLNGTWVNGQRIAMTRVGAGDTIQLGKTVIAVEADAPEPTGPPPLIPLAEAQAGPLAPPEPEPEPAGESPLAPPLPEAPAEVAIASGRCPECNAELPSQARFCLYCGVAIGHAERVPTPPPLAPAEAPEPPAAPLAPSAIPAADTPPAGTDIPAVEPEALASPIAEVEPPAPEPVGAAVETPEAPAAPEPPAADALPEPTPAAPAEPARPVVPDLARQDDELRPVTALFADVVGSTALGERLAPNEVKELIGECVNRMARAVEEYGGTIQAFMGDGIAGFFGMPTAHEDDPERAAHAALRILEVVREYAKDIAAAWEVTDFNVRVGINSGQTAVGIVGGGDQQQVALGDATNVAARLQSNAAPGTIAVGESTAQRLAHNFVLESLGEIKVKGRERPVSVWRLVGVQTGTRAPAPTPLVGRETEVGRLRVAVDELTQGRGQLLLLVGEAGIGKTRLLAELRTITGERAIWLDGQCHSYGGELLYWPFVEMLRSWLGVEDGEASVSVRTKLRAKLASLPSLGSTEVMPQLGRLLSVPMEANGQLEQLSPEERAEDVRRAFAAWVEALSVQSPVILAVDDLHWADPSTIELAKTLLDTLDRIPLLLVTALRADLPSPGSRFRLHALEHSAHRVVELPLTPLSEDASRELVSMLMPEGLDPFSRDQLVKRAEGNPLYLEELLRTLIEGGGLERRQRTWALTITPASLVPPALEGLLVARIDKLSEGARRLAELAAVIGRTFPARALQHAWVGDDFEQNLSVLLRAQFIRELRRYPELEYTFKHGLLQEAVLSTLTPARREELYSRVAGVFDELYATSRDDYLEVLAYYYARGDNLPKALEYLEKAGARAASLNANEQAEELWKRALKVASRCGDAEAEARISTQLDGVKL